MPNFGSTFEFKDANSADQYHDSIDGDGSAADSFVPAIGVLDGAKNQILGTTTDAAVSTDANGSINAHLRGIIVNLINLAGQLPASLGKKVSGSSLSVTLASDHGTIAVSDGAGSLTVDDGAGSLTVDSAQLPASLGKQVNGGSLSITLASDHAGIPVTDGASSLTVDNADMTTTATQTTLVAARVGAGTDARVRNGADGSVVSQLKNLSIIADQYRWTAAVGSASGTNDVSFTVAAGKEWQVQNVRVSFVASATVGTRQIIVQLIESSTVYGTFYLGVTQAASETRVYEFFPGAPDSVTFRSNTVAYHPLPTNFTMPQNMSFRIFDLNNVDATLDTMSVRYLVNARTNELLP